MIDLNDFKHFETSSNGKPCRNKKYMGYCDNCNGPRGYMFKAEDGKVCKSCARPKQIAVLMANKDKGIKAAADLKRGKPSPMRGIKTGRPAWNRGQYFGNKIKTTLRRRMSRRLRHALANNSILGKKYQHIFDILNYSIDDLKSHLESKFTLGMTWDNMGKWHIDHKKPESLFNYSSFEDAAFIECWSLNNLQPLWAIDNIKKSNKYVD